MVLLLGGHVRVGEPVQDHPHVGLHRAVLGTTAAGHRPGVGQPERAERRRHGQVEGGEVAVLALGRLGARELTPSSDLDLVVIYDRPDEAGASDGRRPLDPVTYHVRLTQRLVASLTVPTRRGTLYQVDMRLRPSGNKSPAATQFSGFEAYHQGEAEIWEEMALTRARAIAGDPALVARLEATIRSILCRRREPATVAAAGSSMRALIAREKGEGDGWDMKLAPGGLTDLDFLAQFLVLAHAAQVPELIGAGTAEVLLAAGRAGLVGEEEASRLASAYRLISDVQLWQRFAHDGPLTTKTVPGHVLRRMATALGRPDAKVLKAELDEVRADVRSSFRRILSAAS